MNIFPPVKLHEADMIIIAECFGTPQVKKYLHHLAQSIGTDIVTGTKGPNESAGDYLIKEAAMKGQLQVIDTLLGIESVIAKPVE